MQYRLVTRNGSPYLSPSVVMQRLEREFAYVESDPEQGRRYILELLLQLLATRQPASVATDNVYLDRLATDQISALFVCFGDDPGSETALLSTFLIPDEPLIFDFVPDAHEPIIRPLLIRCATALDYEIAEAQM